MHFFDLEARQWTKELSAAAKTEDGEEFFFHGQGCFQRLANLMVKLKGDWAAHYGGGYDHLLLIPLLGKIKDVILTGSRIFCISFINGVKLYDTFPAWLCSLGAMGKFLDLPKLNYDRKTLEKLSSEELRAYNMRDVDILAKGWQSAKQFSESVGMDHKKTAGASAIEAIRVLEPDTWGAWTENSLKWKDLVGLEAIAPGGHTENFYIGPVRDVYCYDIKSSYPSRYSDPNGLGAGIQESHDFRVANNDPLAVMYVSWFLDASKDGKTIAPAKDAATGLAAGHCENWLTFDERRLLETDERVSQIRFHKCYVPKTRLPDAAKTFQRVIGRWKEQGVPFAKVWYNSLHGKFCELVVKDTWSFSLPKELFLGDLNPVKEYPAVGLWRFDKLLVRDDGFAAPHFQPLNGAYVYGRARADIISKIRRIQRSGWIVYYVDTDSIFTNAPPDVMATILGQEMGNNLGQLAFEGGPFRGYIFGRKLYYLESDDGKTKIAAKGVPLKSLVSGKRVMGVYAEKSGGKNVQKAVFDEIFLTGSAKVFRTGVTPFVVGAPEGKWDKYRMVRTLKPIESNKDYDRYGFGHYMAGAL